LLTLILNGDHAGLNDEYDHGNSHELGGSSSTIGILSRHRVWPEKWAASDSFLRLNDEKPPFSLIFSRHFPAFNDHIFSLFY